MQQLVVVGMVLEQAEQQHIVQGDDDIAAEHLKQLPVQLAQRASGLQVGGHMVMALASEEQGGRVAAVVVAPLGQGLIERPGDMLVGQLLPLLVDAAHHAFGWQAEQAADLGDDSGGELADALACQ